MTPHLLIEKNQPSGLRVVSELIPHLHSVSFGLFFKQGSRYEPKEFAGISHLIEHMLFKGTRKKTSRDILFLLEKKGGLSDGFTGKEISGIYIRAPEDAYRELANLIKEIVEEPSFDSKELEKEKLIVLSEMKSSKEDPEERVFDLLSEAIFENHPLGRSIIGEKETIINITRDEIIKFYYENYNVENTLYISVGKFDNNFYPDIKIKKGKPNTPSTPTQCKKKMKMEPRKDLTQVHVAIGTMVPGIKSKERYSLSLASTALGGGMSSRLFQTMREEKGLVYSISTFYNAYEDIGLFGIYFVIDKTKLYQSFEVLKNEIEKIKKEGFKKEEIKVAKSLVKSSIILGMENPYSRMVRIANWKLLTGEIPDIEETLKIYQSKNADEVSEIFNKFFSSQEKSMALVGAIEENILSNKKIDIF